MSDLATSIDILSGLSPIGLAGLLGYVIYLLIKNQQGQHKIATNHLHPLPDMADTLRRIEENQREQTTLLNEISKGQEYLKARVNGGYKS